MRTSDEIRRAIHELVKRHSDSGTPHSAAELNELLNQFQRAIMGEYYSS